MEPQSESNVPFKKVILNSETPEEIEKKADELRATAQALRDQQRVTEDAKLRRKKKATCKSFSNPAKSFENWTM